MKDAEWEREKKKLLITTECKTRKELGSVDHIRRSWDIDLKKKIVPCSININLILNTCSITVLIGFYCSYLMFIHSTETKNFWTCLYSCCDQRHPFSAKELLNQREETEHPNSVGDKNKTKQLIPLPEKV